MVKKFLKQITNAFSKNQGPTSPAPSAPILPAVSDAIDRQAREYEAWQRNRYNKNLQREQQRQQRKQQDRTCFGEELRGVSKRHRAATIDEEKLARFSLPVLRTEYDLAELLGISRSRLRWFTHDKPADTVCHYACYTIPKRSGGERPIMAPLPELKALQRTILRDILARIPPSNQAHGFVMQRSIVTNAQPHTGKQIVLNLDLKDFFPSITFARVRGWFISIGYPFSVASTLALLCTEHPREPFDHDGTRYYVSTGPRCLVQGAPTSPALANLIAWRLDRRLNGLARKHGFDYTRYADDLTFSGNDITTAMHIRRTAKHIIEDEDFVLHPDKTRVVRRSSRQVVTGVIVNDRVNTPRWFRRRVRAILHNSRTTGLDAQNRINHPAFRACMHGFVGLITMSNPQQGRQLQQTLRAVERQHRPEKG